MRQVFTTTGADYKEFKPSLDTWPIFKKPYPIELLEPVLHAWAGGPTGTGWNSKVLANLAVFAGQRDFQMNDQMPI